MRHKSIVTAVVSVVFAGALATGFLKWLGPPSKTDAHPFVFHSTVKEIVNVAGRPMYYINVRGATFLAASRSSLKVGQNVICREQEIKTQNVLAIPECE